MADFYTNNKANLATMPQTREQLAPALALADGLQKPRAKSGYGKAQAEQVLKEDAVDATSEDEDAWAAACATTPCPRICMLAVSVAFCQVPGSSWQVD